MKQPIETDFDVRNHDAGVDVTFRPTESQYSFVLLADRSLSPRASVRHGKTGDTGDYAAAMSKPQHFVLPVLRSRVLVISSIRL